MKIAYLISAYTDAEHLKRLIKALDDKNSFFFIHVDKKSDFEEFYFEKENIVWLEPRLVTWGGFSQVDVIFAMLKAALNYNNTIDFFVSMTGTDYPIISNQKIRETFFDSHAKQWIAGYKTPIERDALVMTNDLRWNNVMGHLERRIRKCVNSLKKKNPYPCIDGKKVKVYQGSDYWALSRACAQDMLDIFTRNSRLQDWMKTGFIPSELMMTTIFFNSKWAEYGFEIMESDPDFQTISPLHYVIYKDKIKIMTEEDFEDIVNSGKMFFRKAETKASATLLDRIDEIRV